MFEFTFQTTVTYISSFFKLIQFFTYLQKYLKYKMLKKGEFELFTFGEAAKACQERDSQLWEVS